MRRLRRWYIPWSRTSEPHRPSSRHWRRRLVQVLQQQYMFHRRPPLGGRTRLVIIIIMPSPPRRGHNNKIRRSKIKVTGGWDILWRPPAYSLFFIMPCPPRLGIKRWYCRTSDVCLMSVASIGPKSRTERPRKIKIGTEVAHVTRTPLSRSKGQRSRSQVAGHIVAAYRTACYAKLQHMHIIIYNE